LLESGHAYRLSHLQHHQNFPHEDDPEGDPARMSFWRSVFEGPIFLIKLYLWALQRTKRRSAQFYWILSEGIWSILWIIISVALMPYTLAVFWYVIMALVGSWVYPLLTVHLPHRDYGDTPITQTRSLRGKIIPAIFLELTYHLEHHLYPQVPSHNLKKLSKRIDSVLKENGARVWEVW
jgi:beta-carotene hydroxylase